jgi:hypothetical protein
VYASSLRLDSGPEWLSRVLHAAISLLDSASESDWLVAPSNCNKFNFEFDSEHSFRNNSFIEWRHESEFGCDCTDHSLCGD